MKKSAYFSVLLIFITVLCMAQDQVLVNPNQALIYTNPSYAGSNGSIRNQFVYLDMWPNLGGNYVTYYNGLDGYVKRLHGGLALSFMTENMAQGTYRSSQVNLVYAPQFECEKTGLKIIPSLQLTYLQKEVDVSRLTFGSGFIAWNPNGGPPKARKSNFDASGGLLVNYKNLYIGGTVFHINQPDVGLLGMSKLPARFNFNAAYSFSLNEKTLLHFSAVYSQQQKYNAFQGAVNGVFLRHILVGVGYMNSDAFFVNLGYRNSWFSVTGGYDLSFSKLSGNTSGSYQLALGFSPLKKAATQAPSNFEKW